MRLLVVSHPSVLAVNQLPFVELLSRGWDVTLIVPRRWRHDYSPEPFAAQVHPALIGHVHPQPVIFEGAVQRHLYRARLSRLLDRFAPDVAFLDQEFTSAPAAQWGAVLRRRRIPFGVQADENLDRRFSAPVRMLMRSTLKRAAFVAARSPSAARLVRTYSSDTGIFLVPHHVPQWDVVPRTARSDQFVVGYAGRLVPEKGVDLLIEAAAGMTSTTVHLYGDGPERSALLEQAARLGVAVQLRHSMSHEQMAAAYAELDVLVLPSRTTDTWVEQFGRVLVEALWCGVPVVGSSSGEIPWVVETTGGGRIFPEGDAIALRGVLEALRQSPDTREAHASIGRERVARWFSVPAVADQLETALKAFGPWADSALI